GKQSVAFEVVQRGRPIRDAAKSVRAISRRTFLTGAALGAAGAIWSPVLRITPAQATDSCAVPPNFPSTVELYQQVYENWVKAIHVDDVWTCAPRSPSDVVAVANWAAAHGYQLRPRGMMHGWSPLILSSSGTCPPKIVLVDTTQHLTSMSIAAT